MGEGPKTQMEYGAAPPALPPTATGAAGRPDDDPSRRLIARIKESLLPMSERKAIARERWRGVEVPSATP